MDTEPQVETPEAAPASPPRRRGKAARGGSAKAAPEALWREFKELGLAPYEARVLVALLRAGSAASPELAASSGVPRTSTYQLLDGLVAKGIVDRQPGPGPARWVAPPQAELMERLEASLELAEEERIRNEQARTARARARLAELGQVLGEVLAEGPETSLPFVHVVHGASRVKRVYDQMLDKATTELAMFTRPPYAEESRKVNPAVLDMLARGVRGRVLYEALPWDHPDAELFAAIHDAYHSAGVQARVVERLPVKLIVVDRSVMLVGMPDPAQGDDGYPTFLLVEHAGFAELQAMVFDQLWDIAMPLQRPLTKANGHDHR